MKTATQKISDRSTDAGSAVAAVAKKKHKLRRKKSMIRVGTHGGAEGREARKKARRRRTQLVAVNSQQGEQLRNGANKQPHHRRRTTLKNAFEKLDADHSGDIDFREFMAICPSS